MIESPIPLDAIEPVEPQMFVVGEMLELLIQKDQPILQVRLQEGDAFRSHIGKANKVSREHYDVTRSKQDRLAKSFDEANQNLSAINSSQTISVVYLKMLDDFGYSLDPGEFKEYFLDCLSFNNENSEKSFDSTPEQTAFNAVLASKGKTPPHIVDLIKKIDRQPVRNWFKGNTNEWRNFIRTCSNFSQYIKLGDSVTTKNLPEWFKKKREENLDGFKLLGSTQLDHYPDWLFDWQDGLPDPVVVEKDIAEDEDQRELVRRVWQGYLSQHDGLDDDRNAKHDKGIIHFEKWRRKLEGNTNSLVEAMIYFDATTGVYEHLSVDGSNNEEIDTVSEPLSPEESRKRVINDFVEKYRFETDVVALWLDEQLAHGEFLPQVLDWFSGPRKDEELHGLKGRDKKLHNLIKYQLAPFFSVLSTEEKDYILELASSGQSTAQTTLDIAEIFSSHLKSGMISDHPKIEADVIKTVGKWINKFEDPQLKQRLRSVIQGNFTPVNAPVKETEQASVETTTMQEEVAEDIEELRVTSLSAWKRYWIRDYNPEDKSTPVDGENMNEIVEHLDELFETHGESYSIKTSSIINALDWFIRVPEEIKRMWIKEEIDGVEYYKLKRGAVRIFCILDPEGQSISFFPYQKKALSYAFRN